MITSASNRKVRDVAALLKKAAFRKETGCFVVEGIRMFRELPDGLVQTVYATERFLAGAEPSVRERIAGLPHETVAEQVFERMSGTESPQGILAVALQRRDGEEALLSGERPLVLILETIQDPGNLGTMLRAGEGAGLTAVLADRETADLYNPKVIRSTMGSIFRVPVVRTDDLKASVLRLKEGGVGIYAAHLHGSVPYDSVSYTGPAAFMIGNEARGLSEETAALSDCRVRIPMLGSVESLNAAVAASVLLYEAARQRRNGAH